MAKFYKWLGEQAHSVEPTSLVSCTLPLTFKFIEHHPSCARFVSRVFDLKDGEHYQEKDRTAKNLCTVKHLNSESRERIYGKDP